jgi:ectoine hydroxylase-related dioxygenase (phytanoyl-CoA dioxygenase family)
MGDHPSQVTLGLRAGDAVVIDYRLLHGTHANESLARRDCVLLSFIPDWINFPSELKAHVSAHPALPAAEEIADASRVPHSDVFPRFAGRPVDIAINRLPPPSFAIV